MERRQESTTSARTAALTALALLGPVFGVATQLWGQALLLLGLGVLLIAAPPRRSPGAAWCVLAVAIFAIALAAFLPLRWFAIPGWRKTLTGDFRVPLAGTLSPQPWVSLHAVCLLFAGLIFTLYLVTRTWGHQSRRQAARWYAGGIVVLALLALVSLGRGWHVPFWPQVLNSLDGFGIFPNRNQTANVFALAGVMATALAFDAFERRHKSAWFWVAAVIILGGALVQTYSRAGILLFFIGTGAWVLLSFALSGSRKGGAIATAGIVLLLTGFLNFGGGTLERFQAMGKESPPEYRVAIHRDAMHLAAAAPWLGQGAGNFAPVFAMMRNASVDQNRALHPESDWLWVAVEMGWPAAALLGVAFLLWLRQCLPLSKGSDRALRGAALVCGVLFALHSLADVSGHRPGSAWPALFLAGLAIAPRRDIARSRWAAPVFRMLGLVLTLISGWWFASIFSERIAQAAPTPETAVVLADRAERQNLAKQHTEALASADGALRITPLEAGLYYQRGLSRVVKPFATWGAAWDFGTARFLEPHWAVLCFEEGKAWADARQPELALDAWTEGLRRAGKKGPELFYQMLYWSRDKAVLHAMMARLARSGPDYLLVFLRQADRLESELLIGELTDAEPNLKSFSAEQRRALFSVWFQKGDHRLLRAKLLANPDWQKDGWRWLALLSAEAGDFKSACELARDSIPRPAMPKQGEPKPLADLERLFRSRPDDIGLGLQLHITQLSLGKTKEALETLRALQALPNHPAYLAYIEAEQFEESEDWANAWKAWLRFGGKEFK